MRCCGSTLPQLQQLGVHCRVVVSEARAREGEEGIVRLPAAGGGLPALQPPTAAGMTARGSAVYDSSTCSTCTTYGMVYVLYGAADADAPRPRRGGGRRHGRSVL